MKRNLEIFLYVAHKTRTFLNSFFFRQCLSKNRIFACSRFAGYIYLIKLTRFLNTLRAMGVSFIQNLFFIYQYKVQLQSHHELFALRHCIKFRPRRPGTLENW